MKTQYCVSFVTIKGKPVTIPEEEIELVKTTIEKFSDLIHIKDPTQFQHGEPVKVKFGAFAGYEAIVEKTKNKAYVVVRIPSFNQSIYIDVKPEELEKREVGVL